MHPRMITSFAIFDNLNSKQWAMPKQKWRWAVFLKADCTKELSPEIYVSVKEGGTSNSLLAPSLSAGLSLSQIRLAFAEMLLYLLFKRNISKDC